MKRLILSVAAVLVLAGVSQALAAPVQSKVEDGGDPDRGSLPNTNSKMANLLSKVSHEWIEDVDTLRKVCRKLSASSDPKTVRLATVLLSLTDTREWTDSTGKYSYQAHYVKDTVESVVLSDQKKKLTSVPIARLSSADAGVVERIRYCKNSVREEGGHVFDMMVADTQRLYYRSLMPANRDERLNQVVELAATLTDAEKKAVWKVAFCEAVLSDDWDDSMSQQAKAEAIELTALPALYAIRHKKTDNPAPLSGEAVEDLITPIVETDSISLERFFRRRRLKDARGGKGPYEMSKGELHLAIQKQNEKLTTDEIRDIRATAQRMLSSKYPALRRQLTTEQELQRDRYLVGLGDIVIMAKREAGGQLSRAELLKALNAIAEIIEGLDKQ